ncbi:MlaA family lipoprotein [Nitrosococcus oceani]|uniref:VacJ-like lipoprotein n=2 Tax=Nitrosococcus oceani TaxID=1229 RepID=Q3J7G2_NITOC|nr:VacJ family lipoprotein [Nitrosococcus oceani]ABA59234.1 VacJ-like lipoprotein [Nitrosococcus oceani ATCC 19707]KFI18262.1 ABC transporter [Nitrosococcus oceani C-27]KFI21440.1 ABC transporter [Nitrosococcus oceani]GEM21059.1 ABC transporter [Nitrosococcus oceani]
MNYTFIMALWAKLTLLGILLGLSAGCATNATYDASHDPFEGFNRAIYKFNDTADRYVMKPIAKGYDKVVPTPVDKSITNFFSNLHDLVVGVNSIFQGKFHQGLTDFARFLANSTVGIGGLFDVATSGGMVKHDEDFGQTLGVWGFNTGPYLVLPLLGPSNIRDGIGLGVDVLAWPVTYIGNTGIGLGLAGLRTVDLRADLLEATDILKEAALDPYVYTREAFLQRRKFLVHDGKIPKEEVPEEEFEFDEEEEISEEPAEPSAPFPPYFPGH